VSAGENAAKERLAAFIAGTLPVYAHARNDIVRDAQSGLSPYLHFGQLASLRVALDVLREAVEPPLLLRAIRLARPAASNSISSGIDALFEELIVRKELSDNFCLYSPAYKQLIGGPFWGQRTLEEHRKDARDFIYSREDWEYAQTHDIAWNAAQRQLRATGKMHGYMRMYWAKKMLEWSESPEVAIADCVYLNDTYSIDGYDPNGYTGILWSMVGLHDRPWRERSVFGKIRYMNEAGLRRKFDLDAYCRTWLD
jgi:deoxyribodipyrimidine photo-lyase